MADQLARGKHLTALAHVFGLKRRWFGLESDARLRRRIRAAIFCPTKPN